jgi:hypothetical protein
MKTKLLNLIIIMIITAANVFGQNLDKFKSQVDSCGMKLNIPEGLVECKIIENRDMLYDYAVKYPDKDLELRYALRPMKEEEKSFRNKSQAAIFQAIIFNLTQKTAKFQAFPPDNVKHEYNADWGAFAVVELNSKFGEGYKYCMILAIHKLDVADAYYFFLSNTKEAFSLTDLMLPLFSSLQFK